MKKHDMLKYAMLILAGIILYFLAKKDVAAYREHFAVGGEFLLIVLPLAFYEIFRTVGALLSKINSDSSNEHRDSQWCTREKR